MTNALVALLPYVTALAALIEAGTVVFAAAYAVRQLDEGVKSRYLDGLQRVYEELSSDETRAERAAIFDLPDDVDA